MTDAPPADKPNLDFRYSDWLYFHPEYEGFEVCFNFRYRAACATCEVYFHWDIRQKNPHCWVCGEVVPNPMYVASRGLYG